MKKTLNNPMEYRDILIDRILSIPASYCPMIFTDYTVKGENFDVIKWNEDMLHDSGVPISQLRDLCVILENRVDNSPHRLN